MDGSVLRRSAIEDPGRVGRELEKLTLHGLGLRPGMPVRYVGPRRRLIDPGCDAYVVSMNDRGVVIGVRGFQLHVSTDDLETPARPSQSPGSQVP